MVSYVSTEALGKRLLGVGKTSVVHGKDLTRSPPYPDPINEADVLRNINLAAICVARLGCDGCDDSGFLNAEAVTTWFGLVVWSIWHWGIFGMGGKTFLIPLFVGASVGWCQ